MTEHTSPTDLRIGASDSAIAIARAERLGARLGAVTIVAMSAASTVAERRAALLDGEIDVLIHAVTELPTMTAAGIELIAVPKRTTAEDVIVTRTGTPLAALPAASTIGVDSGLRRANVLAARPDLDVVDLTGDPDAILARLETDGPDGGLDAVVVAAADLEHLGLAGELETRSERRSLSQWPTAPAQGALAVEIATAADGAIRRRVARIDHPQTRLVVAAERAVLDRLGVEFEGRVAADAMLEDGLLFLTATAWTADGTRRRASHAGYPEDTADPAAELAARAAEELLAPPVDEAAR